MLLVAGVAVVLLTSLVSSNMRKVQAVEERLQAFYAAEAGVEQVNDWFNRAYYTWLRTAILNGMPSVADPALLHTWDNVLPNYSDATFRSWFEPYPDGQFIDGSGNSSFGRFRIGGPETELVICSGDSGPLERDAFHTEWVSYLPVIHVGDQSGTTAYESTPEKSRLVFLRIIRAPEGSQKIATVIAVGRSAVTGIEVTIECELARPWLPEILTPAALISRTGAASNGQFDVSWGEVWTQDNIDLPNNIDKFPNEIDDPWFAAITESYLVRSDTDPLRYANGHSSTAYTDSPIANMSDPNYYVPYTVLDPNINSRYQNRQNLLQHQDLSDRWPDYEYTIIKNFFISQGYPMYTPNADGTITGPDPVNPDETVTRTFEDMFNLDGLPDDAPLPNSPDDIDWDKLPPLYFIDTLDGQPPNAAGTNLPTMVNNGGSSFMYGMFFIAGNVDLGGTGDPPSLNAPEDPSQTPRSDADLDKCRLAGLYYSYGNIEVSGRGDIYGALYAKRGFQGGGDWSIHYDWRLNDPYRNQTSSRTKRSVWNTFDGPFENMPGLPPLSTTVTQTGG